MTKKHKAKGGHQQKHGKRKSGGRDKFSRESSAYWLEKLLAR